MTKPKKLEPVKCKTCERKPNVGITIYGKTRYRVQCKYYGCWAGSFRKTRTGAVKVWNKVMETFEDQVIKEIEAMNE